MSFFIFVYFIVIDRYSCYVLWGIYREILVILIWFVSNFLGMKKRI